MAKKITFKELSNILKDEVHCSRFSDDYIMEITPSVARKILGEFNGPNRKIYQSSLKNIIYNLSHNLWDNELSDSIMFDKDGRLSDGQHRLLALSTLHDDSIYIRVRVGIGANRSIYTNTGTTRKAGDNIRISGLLAKSDEEYFNSKIETALNFLGRYYYSTGTNRIADKFEYLKKATSNHMDIIRGFQTPFNPCTVKNACSSGILAALLNMYALNEIDNADIERICNILKDGIPESAADAPIIYLRNKTLETSKEYGSARTMLFKYTHACVRSWKAHKTSKPRIPVDMPNAFDFADTPRALRIITRNGERKFA